MDLKIAGKTALVTGSTAGIGLAIAAKLADEGAEVIVTGRNQAKLDAAAQTVGQLGKVRAVLADPATEEGAKALIAAVPQVDILVNNLGIYEARPFVEITDAEWRNFFEVNVLSGVRLSRHYFPGMLERNWGRVIFISSESGLMTPGEMVHYGMTKTAQLAVARGMADATRGTQVTVNSVLPGPTRSEGIVAFIRSVVENKDASEAEREAAFFSKLRPLSLIRRLIEADEVAAMTAFLASPLASATNGAAIRAEGGILPTIA
nr:SDR family oxidoreductase [Novosphingobium panipatense]